MREKSMALPPSRSTRTTSRVAHAPPVRQRASSKRAGLHATRRAHCRTISNELSPATRNAVERSPKPRNRTRDISPAVAPAAATPRARAVWNPTRCQVIADASAWTGAANSFQAGRRKAAIDARCTANGNPTPAAAASNQGRSAKRSGVVSCDALVITEGASPTSTIFET
jgi:hypothetical protein